VSFTGRIRAVLRRLRGSEPVAAPIDVRHDAGDGLSEADLAVLATLGRCTACRACDVAFDGYAAAARPVFRGPSELVVGYVRSASEHAAARGYLESLQRGDLEALSRICPVQISFVALADLVGRRVDALSPNDPAPPESRAPHDPG
jgi:hypothetical protein